MRIAIFIFLTFAILLYLLYLMLKKEKSKTEILLKEIEKVKSKASQIQTVLPTSIKPDKKKVSSPKKKSRFELMDI